MDKDEEKMARPRMRAREKGLLAVAVCALVAAVAACVLYATSLVPADAAAKVNDDYVYETEVASLISQYRIAGNLTDDAEFASELLSQGENVTTFRQSFVNQLALNLLLEQKAAELGVEPTDEQVDEQVEAVKSVYSFGDDDVWAELLSSYGMTDEDIRQQYYANLACNAVLAAEVEKREADDDEVLAYLQEYLAGSTQKHVYRIVLAGDDREDKAAQCYAELQAAAASGDMDVQTFSEIARRYSDEDGVQETGGSYAWSGANMDDTVKEAVADLSVGDYTAAMETDGGESLTLVFCDAAYAFPAASELLSVPEDVPDELMDEVRDAAADDLWSDDCSAYLANLLASAKITYYPVPDGADYNVDMTSASAS